MSLQINRFCLITAENCGGVALGVSEKNEFVISTVRFLRPRDQAGKAAIS